MKFGLLINAGTAPVKNIGDYIQSLAQEQFLENVDCLVERENLNDIKSDCRLKVIMSGWFMRNPQNFPPSPSVDPLFVSFHVSPSIAEEFFSEETCQYLKKYEPIGCRDHGTEKLLNAHGITTYFTGCLTLTLGLKYKAEKKGNIPIFVDPYYELPSIKGHFSSIMSLWNLIRNMNKIRQFMYSFETEYASMFNCISYKLNKLVMAAAFYNTYKTYFDDEIIFNARFIKHQVNQSDFENEEQKLEYARKLLGIYAEAPLVVTSRIHCALPCLGLETPVIFVESEGLRNLRSQGRFEGILEFFHRLRWTPKGIVPITSSMQEIYSEGKMNLSKILTNKSTYKIYCDKLIHIVKNFVTLEH